MYALMKVYVTVPLSVIAMILSLIGSMSTTLFKCLFAIIIAIPASVLSVSFWSLLLKKIE